MQCLYHTRGWIGRRLRLDASGSISNINGVVRE